MHGITHPLNYMEKWTMQELPLWLVSPHSGGQIAYDRLITLLSVQTSLIKSHQTNADENIKCPETFGFSHNIFHPSLAWHKHSPDTEISPICGHDLEVRSVTVPVCTIPPRRQEGEGRGGHPRPGSPLISTIRGIRNISLTGNTTQNRIGTFSR